MAQHIPSTRLHATNDGSLMMTKEEEDRIITGKVKCQAFYGANVIQAYVLWVQSNL